MPTASISCCNSRARPAGSGAGCLLGSFGEPFRTAASAASGPRCSETGIGSFSGSVAKFRHRRRASKTLRYPQTLCRLEFESFTDNCDGLSERTGTEAESAFDDTRLAADVLREVEGRRLAFA